MDAAQLTRSQHERFRTEMNAGCVSLAAETTSVRDELSRMTVHVCLELHIQWTKFEATLMSFKSGISNLCKALCRYRCAHVEYNIECIPAK
jgi:hypothetical protein